MPPRTLLRVVRVAIAHVAIAHVAIVHVAIVHVAMPPLLFRAAAATG